MDVSGARWRKSSYSGGNGGDCVEIAAVWRKSSYSGGNGGNCVELAAVARPGENAEPVIAIRDSKDPRGPELAFTPAAWGAFAARVRDGAYDLT